MVKRRVFRVLGLLSATLLLNACQPAPPMKPTSYDDMTSIMNNALEANRKFSSGKRLPPSVTAALVPSMQLNLPKKRTYGGRKFNLSVHDVPAKKFFMSLVKGTKTNIAVSPEVKGNISLNLKNVSVADVLNVVQDVYGYEYSKTPFGYEIFPNQIQTRMFHVNYLDAKRRGKSITTVSTGQISQKIQGNASSNSGFGRVNRSSSTEDKTSGGEVETTSELNFWGNLSKTLGAIVGGKSGQSVIVNPEAGLVIVKAYPAQLRQVAKYLDSIQSNMDRQVILEAKILEVVLNHNYQAGIDWKILGAQFNALANTGTFIGTTINNENFPKAFELRTSSGHDFHAYLRLLGTQGHVQVLSSPRVSTLNNQKAVIKVGTDEFFVTGISTSTTETASSTTPTQDVQLTPFFSGITLDVTPQIGAKGWVVLHIHPSISEVKDQQKTLTIAGQNSDLPLASSTIRETDTIVRAKNGQVIVLGGLMQHQTGEDVAQLPYFGNIPFLGTLFRNTKQQSKKSELVILLRPVVIKHCSWNADMRNSKRRLKRLNTGFHWGARPDIFGTEGERHVPYHHYLQPAEKFRRKHHTKTGDPKKAKPYPKGKPSTKQSSVTQVATRSSK